jgi:poly(A) polymerase
MTRISPDWLASAPARAVCAALEGGGHQAWFVGGCVRNALLGEEAADLDITTDARPERVIALVEAAGLRAVPTGIEHGTVTVVAEGRGFEVTTFRRDVETDGRRAVVAFSDSMEEDAARRDFTMNALYCRIDGVVVDPVGEGLADLAARRVRFIGDDEERIREDYLRILRFFRFHAWYGGDGIDPEGLAACAALAEGVEGLSRERIGHEVMKLLAAPDPAPAVASMAASGVLMRVLQGANPATLAPLVHLEGLAGEAPDPVLRLAALGGHEGGRPLRLSKPQMRALEILSRSVEEAKSAAELGYRLGRDMARKALLLRVAVMGVPPLEGDFAAIETGAKAVCPVSAKDFMPALEGAALGRALAEAEARWVASGFSLTRENLLS